MAKWGQNVALFNILVYDQIMIISAKWIYKHSLTEHAIELELELSLGNNDDVTMYTWMGSNLVDKLQKIITRLCSSSVYRRYAEEELQGSSDTGMVRIVPWPGPARANQQSGDI